MDRPPVTFLLTAYNQPDFIADSVKSALAQTYTPLTVIISDDCSTDDTYARIEQAIAGYEGPHRIRLYRNPKNVAIGHVRDLLRLVETEFCVLGHGDDLFHPERVAMQVGRMIERDLAAVACNATIIDEQGREQGLRLPKDGPASVSLDRLFRQGANPAQLGALLAWRHELFTAFPEPDPPTRRIDQIVSFRALLLRGLELMPEPLVKWRHHGMNRSPALQRRNAADEAATMRVEEKRLWARIGHAHFMLNDLSWWLERHPDDPRAAALEKGRRVLAQRLLRESGDWARLRYRMARAKLAEH